MAAAPRTASRKRPVAREEPAQISAFFDAAIKWIDDLTSDPKFRAHRAARLGVTLFPDETPPDQWPDDLVLPSEKERQHRLVTSFFHLHDALESLRQTEFYFRRYPFRGLPVTKAEHFRNSCEMYFSQFYVLRSRLKTCLNQANGFLGKKLDIAAILKQFDSQFDQELRARNRVNHHETFSDLALERIRLTNLLASSKDRAALWRSEHARVYRETCREWSTRARRKADIASTFVSAVAKVLLEHIAFLRDQSSPIQGSQAA